jgi:hypothetical protein
MTLDGLSLIIALQPPSAEHVGHQLPQHQLSIIAVSSNLVLLSTSDRNIGIFLYSDFTIKTHIKRIV